jgi:hypothetical protein
MHRPYYIGTVLLERRTAIAENEKIGLCVVSRRNRYKEGRKRERC